MGRNHHHHHLKLPDHLYISPPTPPPSSNAFASSFLSVRSVVYQTSGTSLFYDPSSSARAVSDRIPGWRTSAAFLTTLRANINLEYDSAPTSLTNTPDCLRPINMASSTGSLPPPSPSPLVQVSEIDGSQAVEPRADALADIPPLTTTRATSQDDKVDALHIIADSVAQQRQIASKAIMFHPGVISILVLVFGLIYSYFYKGARSDLAIVGTTSAGVLMAFMISVRYLAGGYIDAAEKVGTWTWLDKGRDVQDAIGDEDEIIVSRFGTEAIGAIIMRGVREAGTSNGNGSPKKRRQNSSGKNAPITGQIRGFSVKNRFRMKGVGTELLEEAIKICQDKGWQGPEFAKNHANSARVLMKQFNGTFDKADQKALAMLEKVKEDAGVGVSNRKGKR